MDEAFAAVRAGGEAVTAYRKRLRALYRREAGARVLAAVNTTTPFRERLVWFWRNHFTVSIRNPHVRRLAGAFEREAIRPHIVGRFAELLLAAVQHPAMQLYLDNYLSVGTNSPVGRRRGKGTNENLAREILEHYTLGVEDGYSQADVGSFALMLTGWGFDRRQASQNQTFTFATDRHEPGPKVLLGVRYDEAGLNEGEAALEALAAHRSTERHLAAKLASHFAADDPPPESVKRLARAFTDNGGDLGVVSRALVAEPATWVRAQRKVRSPAELVVATARATGFHGGEARPLLESLRLIGQLPFFAPSPAGYPD